MPPRPKSRADAPNPSSKAAPSPSPKGSTPSRAKSPNEEKGSRVASPGGGKDKDGKKKGLLSPPPIPLDCKKCLDPFNTDTKIPRLLGCGHSYCNSCLTLPEENGKPGVFVCPIDLKVQSIDKPESVPKNFYLIDIMLSPPPLKGGPICQVCDKKHAAKFRCLDCEEDMCEKMKQAHVQFKQTKDHRLQAMEEVKDPLKTAQAAVLPPQVSCAEHKQPISYFDRDCNKVICRDCFALCHAGHNCTSIAETVNTLRSDLQALGSRSRAKYEAFRAAEERVAGVIEGLDKNVMQQSKDIAHQFQVLRELLQAREDALMQELKDTQANVKKTLEWQQETLKQHKNLFESAALRAEIAVAHEEQLKNESLSHQVNVILLTAEASIMLSAAENSLPPVHPLSNESDVLLEFNHTELEARVKVAGNVADRATLECSRNSVVQGIGIRRVRPGVITSFVVIAYDRNGERMKKGGDAFSAKWNWQLALDAKEAREAKEKILEEAKAKVEEEKAAKAKLKEGGKGDKKKEGKVNPKESPPPPASKLAPEPKLAKMVSKVMDAKKAGKAKVAEKFVPKDIVTMSDEMDGTYVFKFTVENEAKEGDVRELHVLLRGVPIPQSPFPVRILSAKEKFVNMFGGHGKQPGSFSNPQALAFHNRELFVADCTNRRIQVFGADCSFRREWGRQGHEEGMFQSPLGLAISTKGEVFVSDHTRQHIQVYNVDGKYLRKIGSTVSGPGHFNNPCRICLSPDESELFVSDENNHRVQVFGLDGTFHRMWGSMGPKRGQFNKPNGIAVSKSGEVFVCDSGNHRIQVFSRDGQYLRKFGGQGAGEGAFGFPQGLFLDPAANELLVCDQINNRVCVLRIDGVFIRQFGSGGPGEGESLQFPRAAIISDGLVYVCDQANNRIVVFE
jgi:sugar lactone lactonase YvrE